EKKDQNLSRFISQFLYPFSMECEGKGSAGHVCRCVCWRRSGSSGRNRIEMDHTMTISPHNRKNAVISWTGGKDGCFSCLKAMSEGYRITHLLHFTNVKKRGSHELNPGIVRAQSESMGIPLVQKDF